MATDDDGAPGLGGRNLVPTDPDPTGGWYAINTILWYTIDSEDTHTTCSVGLALFDMDSEGSGFHGSKSPRPRNMLCELIKVIYCAHSDNFLPAGR